MRDSDRVFRPFQRRSTALRVAALASAFAVGFTAADLRSPSPTIDSGSTAGSPTPDASIEKSGDRPAERRWGIPVGFARTERGATAAAVGYVLSGSVLLDMAPTRVPEAITLMSAEASSTARVAEAQAKLSGLRQVLAAGRGPTRYDQAALAVRMEAFSDERARVSVWSVGVLSRDGTAAPQAGWTTSTFELVWEREDWKIWSEQITPGPTPDLNGSDPPATSVELDTRLDGFTIWEAGR